MTLYYAEERDALIENHPHEYVSFDDDGRLVVEFGEMPGYQKRKAFLNIAVEAIEASDEYAITTEPETEWLGDEE
jgi:L-asparaginase II